MSEERHRWPLWEVFIRAARPAHKHSAACTRRMRPWRCGRARRLHAARGGVSIWVVPSSAITASDPAEKDELFEPTGSKIYRHPTFYKVPDEVGHM